MLRLRAIHFVPLLAVIALLSWAFASPIGAGPDDDYHLASTWCAVSGVPGCAEGTSTINRRVPAAIPESRCFAQHPEMSASCQNEIDFSGHADTLTERGNFIGEYPPVYYGVMHLFVGGNVQISALIMRVVNVLLFVALVVGLYILLPIHRRPTLVWTWVITTVPMGMFLIASNNPSGWAVVGVGTTWLAMLGFFETQGWRSWSLGMLAILTTVMAAGSRGDAALYSVCATGAAIVLAAPRLRHKWRVFGLKSILAIATIFVGVLFFISARQSQSGLTGFSGGSGGINGQARALSGFGLFAYNFLNVPFLWAGNFGEWGLGWLDTSMPSIVTYSAIVSFAVVGFSALSRLWGRKLFVVLAAGFTLWFVPVYVLTVGGSVVGEQIQPRYILPLIVLLAGLVLITKPGFPFYLTRAQTVLVISTLSVANFVALHMNIRRYVTGIDAPGWNLDAGIEWWWNSSISPMTVWLVGSIAFAATIAIATREVHRVSRVPQLPPTQI